MTAAQSILFDLPAPESAPPLWRLMTPAHWVAGVWLHVPSGWEIHHCGYPTANFPYYIVTAAGEKILNPLNGKGFQRLSLARQYVEEHTKEAR